MDANDGSDSQSNNAPTQMILYQDKSLKEPSDLVEITKALARKQADDVINRVLSKEPATKYAV